MVIPIVTYELKDGDVGYIKCDSFGASTAATVQEALEELEGRADVWIMDLRANPGGTDTAVNLTAGKFTNGIMVYMLSADGLAYYRGIRPDAPDYTDVPVVVLTSPGAQRRGDVRRRRPGPRLRHLRGPADLRQGGWPSWS